jgi:hypothetical protein
MIFTDYHYHYPGRFFSFFRRVNGLLKVLGDCDVESLQTFRLHPLSDPVSH